MTYPRASLFNYLIITVRPSIRFSVRPSVRPSGCPSFFLSFFPFFLSSFLFRLFVFLLSVSFSLLTRAAIEFERTRVFRMRCALHSRSTAYPCAFLARIHIKKHCFFVYFFYRQFHSRSDRYIHICIIMRIHIYTCIHMYIYI